MIVGPVTADRSQANTALFVFGPHFPNSPYTPDGTENLADLWLPFGNSFSSI